MELFISQVALKNQIGSTTLAIYIKCGDKKEVLKCQITPTSKLVKFQQPILYAFDCKDTKYVHLFVQTEEDNGYMKPQGSHKFVIADLPNKDTLIRIDLEFNNILSLIVRCNQEQQPKKTSPRASQQPVTNQWTQSLRDPTKKRYGSPQASQRQAQIHRSPQVIKRSTQQSNGSFHNKSSSSSIQQQKVLQECKNYLQTNVLDESEEFQTSPDQRADVPQPLDYTRLDKIQQVMQLTQNTLQQQQQSSVLNNLSHKDSSNYFEEPSQYKQMIKDLSLLLDVQQDADAVVHAVRQLLNKHRQQSEVLIKTQCECQILQAQVDSLKHSTTIIEQKQDDFKASIKLKLNTYKSLFEENVQLKNILKEDLQKIVDLNIELRELKADSTEQLKVDKQVQELRYQIEQVCKDVEQKQSQHDVLMEEIHQITTYSKIHEYHSN